MITNLKLEGLLTIYKRDRNKGIPFYSWHFIRQFKGPVYINGGGGLQVSEATRGGLPHLSCKHDQVKMKETFVLGPS